MSPTSPPLDYPTVCKLVGKLVIEYELALSQHNTDGMALALRQQLVEEQKRSAELTRQLEDTRRQLQALDCPPS
jgi:hypothetical protein